MPTYQLKGISVDFPFEAYDCQLVYMEKVIQSLQEKSNALLESPTGTGKTLCLLCATLAWRKSLGPFSQGRILPRARDAGDKNSRGTPSQHESSGLPTIVYTSRTHSQIRQVIQELKRTNYRPKMAVLGSREQMCIHKDVSLLRGRAQTNACHSLCKKRKKNHCKHYPLVADFMAKNPNLGDEPIDIEDLVNIGNSSGPCPYYMSRDLHKVVDIIFAPYNYLIDRGIRKSLSIEWDNSILIFDEAHNLESLCAEAASFDMPSGLLTACISEAEHCVGLATVRRDKLSDKSINPDTFAILGGLLKLLQKVIGEVTIESKALGFTKPGPYIYELLRDLKIKGNNASSVISSIEEAVVLLEEEATDNQSRNTTNKTMCRLESMGDIFKIIFRDDGTDHARHYRVHIQDVESRGEFGGKISRILSWWCFNPGIAMECFSKLGVGSIILTSGTLSPMDSFAGELKLDFPIRLENPHVIEDNQLWSGVVPVGPSGYTFNSSYKTRDSPKYKQELGNAIVNFARVVPDGLLVFFPSYYMLEQCISYWKNSGNDVSASSSSVWERILKHKSPVLEPRDSSQFLASINEYMSKISSAKGAIFFAVCRGKVSEGLDFADHAGRAVIVTGLPFATTTDPKVRLKREFLDQQSSDLSKVLKPLTGEQWYTQQATRAVNQAVGRVIRHRHDYGAIIFCDERFLNAQHQSQISRWIQPRVKFYSNFGDVVYTLTRFFRDAKISGPTKFTSTRPERTDNLQIGSEKLIEIFDEQPLPQPGTSSQDLAPLNTGSHDLMKLYHGQSSSSVAKVKQGNNLEHIQPANRSSLYSYKGSQSLSMKGSSDVLIFKKRTLISSKNEVVDLSADTSSDENTSKNPISRCSVKKLRLLKTEHDVKTEPLSPPCSNLVSAKHAQDGKKLLLSEMNVLSSPVTCIGGKEKGADFLIQAKEMLGDLDYKKFMGFMTSLKSKTTVTASALECIMRMFATPDRFPLLCRFKDYVPQKYRSKYEEYAKACDKGDSAADCSEHLGMD